MGRSRIERYEFITEAGRITPFFTIVSPVRSIYIMNKNGEKRIIGFSFEGSFLDIPDSFVKENHPLFGISNLESASKD